MKTLRRIKLTLEFDGSAFEGWQTQAEGRPSVEVALVRALEGTLGHPVKLQGAGRTDSGVHARGMTAHFDTTTSIPVDRIGGAAMGRLPESLAIVGAEDVAPDFDARRDALLRWYRYQIQLGGPAHPLGPRCWRIQGEIDLDVMARATAKLEGDHDFTGFRASKCTAKRTQLTMLQARMLRSGDVLAIDFKCRSFLMRMVRLMVGAIIATGREKLTPGEIDRILKTGRRPHPVRSAPADGLCLMAVAYSEAERESILTDERLPPSF